MRVPIFTKFHQLLPTEIIIFPPFLTQNSIPSHDDGSKACSITRSFEEKKEVFNKRMEFSHIDTSILINIFDHLDKKEERFEDKLKLNEDSRTVELKGKELTDLHETC